MDDLKTLREAKGMTQIELAQRSGVSLPYVRMIEQGGAGAVSLKIRRNIIRALGGQRPKEFGQALHQDDLYSESNPVIPDSIRRFINNLEVSAKVAGDSEALAFLRQAKDKNQFLWLKTLLYMAKSLRVRIPRV